MSKHHKKIEQLNSEIAASGLDPQHKTYAVDVLAEVDEITNGHEDKIQGITDAMLALTGYMIRRDIFLQDTHAAQIESMKEMVSSHAKECPLADQIPTLVIDAMKAQAVKEDGSWGGEERRGRDGRDGRDVVVGTKAARLSGPAWPIAIICVCAVAIVAMFKLV